MDRLNIKAIGKGVTFTVKVIPSSRKNEIAENLNGVLKVKVTAAPEKGKANKCLVDYLAQSLSIRKKYIEIKAGQTESIKNIKISNVKKQDIEAELTSILKNKRNL